MRHKLWSALALGWQGTDREWKHFNRGYLFLAAFATPLVLSVHSVVSWDFASALVPGWHSTIFAPYFVAGAIFSAALPDGKKSPQTLVGLIRTASRPN